MIETIRYRPEPTPLRFHRSRAFFRGLRGPIGSGKSVACAAEIMARALAQRPFEGVRRTRFAVVRNTYGELRTTTLRTWNEWFGALTALRGACPIEGRVVMPHPDGRSQVDLELIFLSLDRAEDVRKLKSLDLTGVWCNEACELPVEALHMAAGRVGRYPSLRRGGPSWWGIIADTNPPDVDNWWYALETSPPEGHAFFVQPPALLLRETRDSRGRLMGLDCRPNPAAENIAHHAGGFDYYLRQTPGKPPEWVRVYLGNSFGSARTGQLVYADYGDLNHTDRRADPGLGHLIWSHDFNFTPLSSFVAQRRGDDVFAVDEIVLPSAVAEQAALEFVARYRDFAACRVLLYGDASGNAGARHGHGSNYLTLERVLREAGFAVESHVPKANPPIVDGQNCLRARICDAAGRRAFFVNPAACPTLDRGLATLKLKEGSSFQEEESRCQHIASAARYYAAADFPLNGEKSFAFNLFG